MFRARHCPSSGEHEAVHTSRTSYTVPPVYFRRLSSQKTQHLQSLNIFYPLDASSASFNGLIPVTDMYSIIFSWWWAVFCPKHVETYYKWNIYLLSASSWCSYLSLYDARKHKTEKKNVSIFVSIYN